MNCLPCFNNDDDDEGNDQPAANAKKETPSQVAPSPDAAASSNAQAFTFRELAMATKNFRQECLLGEGGFGRVFKGKLQSTSKVVAVKQLDRNGMQGNKEFLVEVLMLALHQHPNLVNLIGYCADGDQRLLVYEFMPMGSLENRLFGDDPDNKPIDWYTRMKIASGAANGLEYLHDKANPPIIYRDLKPSNILLDDTYEPKLSDCGLAKLGAGGGKVHPTSRVMGTYGYSAPEYSSSGELTLKSDIYSFGVVLLELITGRKVIDTNRPNNDQNLVTWAQPIFREPKRFPEMADPRLNKEFPVTGLNQAVGVCAMCLQEEPSVRPLIGDVVAALSFLSVPQPNIVPASIPAFTPPPEQKMHYENEVSQNQSIQQPDKHGSNHDDESSESGSEEEDDRHVSDRESVAEQPNEGSCRNSVTESYNTAECGNQSGRGSGRYSDEASSYSDADTADVISDDINDDIDNTVGNLSSSSNHGSSRRSSSTEKTGFRRRKMVVTFKEPSIISRRNGSKKVEDESTCQSSSSSSSSSSESSSECEDVGTNHRGPTNGIDGSEKDHRIFDKSGEHGPKLWHLQTR